MGLLADAKSMLKKDPAARSLAEVMLLYPGFHALVFYRVSHWFYKHGRLFCARMVSQWGGGFTGIEIHPGATIGDGLFIDHGAGVVIGETAEIGNNVTLYHGVTLGGTGKDEGKRHPTIGDNVLIGTGCKVLGPIITGANSRIGANSVVLSCIPARPSAIGIPACVVRVNGSKVARSSEELNQRDYPDVVHADIKALQQRIAALECALADPAGCAWQKNGNKKSAPFSRNGAFFYFCAYRRLTARASADRNTPKPARPDQCGTSRTP